MPSTAAVVQPSQVSSASAATVTTATATAIIQVRPDERPAPAAGRGLADLPAGES
jgi:hypothetical protein